MTRSESNNAANLSEPALTIDCRIKSGNDEGESRWLRRSRAPAPRFSRDATQLVGDLRLAAAGSPFDARCPKIIMEARAISQCGSLIA
jgi:hypothetical protein